jgi:Cu/Ag efflux protein CusF
VVVLQEKAHAGQVQAAARSAPSRRQGKHEPAFGPAQVTAGPAQVREVQAEVGKVTLQSNKQ